MAESLPGILEAPTSTSSLPSEGCRGAAQSKAQHRGNGDHHSLLPYITTDSVGNKVSHAWMKKTAAHIRCAAEDGFPGVRSPHRLHKEFQDSWSYSETPTEHKQKKRKKRKNSSYQNMHEVSEFCEDLFNVGKEGRVERV